MRAAMGLTMFVIYERPLDAPEHFVVRRWIVAGGKIYADCAGVRTETLEEARAIVPAHHPTRLPRSAEDDAKIVEVWV